MPRRRLRWHHIREELDGSGKALCIAPQAHKLPSESVTLHEKYGVATDIPVRNEEAQGEMARIGLALGRPKRTSICLILSPSPRDFRCQYGIETYYRTVKSSTIENSLPITVHQFVAAEE